MEERRNVRLGLSQSSGTGSSTQSGRTSTASATEVGSVAAAMSTVTVDESLQSLPTGPAAYRFIVPAPQPPLFPGELECRERRD